MTIVAPSCRRGGIFSRTAMTAIIVIVTAVCAYVAYHAIADYMHTEEVKTAIRHIDDQSRGIAEASHASVSDAVVTVLDTPNNGYVRDASTSGQRSWQSATSPMGITFDPVADAYEVSTPHTRTLCYRPATGLDADSEISERSGTSCMR